jgi:hypothetical protein
MTSLPISKALTFPDPISDPVPFQVTERTSPVASLRITFLGCRRGPSTRPFRKPVGRLQRNCTDDRNAMGPCVTGASNASGSGTRLLSAVGLLAPPQWSNAGPLGHVPSQRVRIGTAYKPSPKLALVSPS